VSIELNKLNELAMRQAGVIIDQMAHISVQNMYIADLEASLEEAKEDASSLYEARIESLEDRNGEIMDAISSWIDGEHPVNTGGQAAVLMSWAQYNALRDAFGLSARQPKKASPARSPSPAVATILHKSAEQLQELLSDGDAVAEFE
jgi:hypothetical protein